MINDSKKNLSSIQQDARQIRKDHLIELADNYSNENNVTQQTAINELLEQEDIRQTFKTVKTNLKPMQRPNLKALWVSIDENGNYCKDVDTKKVYRDQETIHKEILHRNAEHLAQASSKPFATGWLKKRLKWDGTGGIADKMLTGQILNEYKFGESMQLYLESLQSSDLSKLNFIELFDAQANAGFQIFIGHKMIQNAVEQNLLQEESYGSTPGKIAGSALLQKILTIDQLRVERRAGGDFRL